MLRTARALTMLSLLLLAGVAHARPPQPDIPPMLRQWTGWVLQDHREIWCAGLGEGRACDWPGHLDVQIAGTSGDFVLDVWVDRESNVALPGDRTAWPLAVVADDKPGLVQALGDKPFLLLSGGHHTVRGHLDFGQTPELLAVPDEIGVVVLRLGGQTVEMPRRDGEGRLFLRQDEAKNAAVEDALTVSVARQIVDAVPLRVVTRLKVRMAGRPRDLVLGKVLLAGARPVSAQSELPMQVGADGALRVHGRPGEHTIEITAVQLANAASLTVPTLDIPGVEAQETWVWTPDETLRSVELTGLSPIDPERTQLADDWKHAGRCYVATPGQTLGLTETRRGETEPPPSRLTLTRDLWLDLDGQRWTARDHFDGEMHQGWRLDVLPGMELGRVAVVDQPTALLITEAPGNKAFGVELRDGAIKLEADARLAVAGGLLDAVGWQADVQSLQTHLHLPPGWELLAVTGVDQKPQTWLDSWDLLDFFFVLLVAAAVWKLLGKGWGVLALLALILCHGEDGAPRGEWLSVLAALALTRVVTTGKLGVVVRLWHGVAVVVLVATILPFAAIQIREGLYPQVGQWGKAPLSAGGGRGDDGWNGLVLGARDLAPAAPPPEALEEAKAAEAADSSAGATREAVAGKMAKMNALAPMATAVSSGYQQDVQQLRQLDPGAVVQTGPGVPRWQWTTLALGWSGPVRHDHQIQLWLLSPMMQLALAILRVLLLVALGLRLIDRDRVRAAMSKLGALGLLLVALTVATTVTPGAAVANELPSSQLLDEMAKRLVAADACDGPCLVVSDLRLEVTGDRLVATAEVSAQRDTGMGLPGPWDPLQISDVRVDGEPTRALRRLPGGLIAVRVPKGAHVVTVEGQLVHRSVVTLQLDAQTLPRHLTVQSQDWTADGLQPGQVKDSLQLTRIQGLPGAQTAGDAEPETLELPPWFHVQRVLMLGLPWRTQTTVTRERTGRAEVLRVPLLAGERVISDGVTTEVDAQKNTVAVLHFGRDDGELTYEAELPVTPVVTLQASAQGSQPWAESWRLQCSPIWQCQAKGPPPVHTQNPETQQLEPLWHPYAGEQVAITVLKPAGAKGAAVTIDAANYDVTPGQRLLEATLGLTIRTSQGGTQTLTLPDGASVQSVTYGGAARAIRPVGRKLVLPLDPGEQVVEVKWQQPWDRGLHEVMPPVDLGGPAVNVLSSLHLGDARWLLWTHGPAWGPAVLFWSAVLVILLLAAGLGRLRGLPVKTRHWALLGLGLAPLGPPGVGVAVAWFVALAWRQHRGQKTPPLPAWQFDLAQLSLVALTWAFFGTLYASVYANLLGQVDMQVSGAGSDGQHLHWYVDRVASALPQPGVWSVPLTVWRVAMLAWSLWLVAALLRWLPWAWRAISAGGLWQKLGKQRTVPQVVVADPPAQPADPGPDA